MIRELSKCVGEYKKSSILTSVYVALEVMIEAVIPFMMALIIDNGVMKSDMSYIAVTGSILVVLTILSLTLSFT